VSMAVSTFPSGHNPPGPEDALRALAAQLREEGTPISPHVVEPAAAPKLGAIAAAGPRAEAAPGEYALVVEAVREGYLLHYGEPRLLAGHDADLGHTTAVAILSDLIGNCAQLHTEGREGEIPQLWQDAARAISARP
jgi:hypothetical protein